MANNEILSEIKLAEEDAKKAVSEATEEKNKKIAKARAELGRNRGHRCATHYHRHQ